MTKSKTQNNEKQITFHWLKDDFEDHALRACIIVFIRSHTEVHNKQQKSIQFDIFALWKTTK